MAARAIGSGTISFGLVSIPVRLYVATHSEQVSFHLLHEKDGTRVKQQLFCPRDKRVVSRAETVRGFEVRKNRFVTFTPKELDALEADANRAIEIQEFVPLGDVDPIFFKDVHYLGPEKGGAKAYRLLADAMRQQEKVGVAQFTHHGKEHLVIIRPYEEGLVLHTLYYADEVRPFSGIDVERGGKPSARELGMAEKLVDQLAAKGFHPERYHDAYRERVQAAIKRKEKGEDIRVSAPEPTSGKVVDLMEALQASLGGKGRKGSAAAGGRRSASAARGATRRRGSKKRRAS